MHAWHTKPLLVWLKQFVLFLSRAAWTREFSKELRAWLFDLHLRHRTLHRAFSLGRLRMPRETSESFQGLHYVHTTKLCVPGWIAFLLPGSHLSFLFLKKIDKTFQSSDLLSCVLYLACMWDCGTHTIFTSSEVNWGSLGFRFSLFHDGWPWSSHSLSNFKIEDNIILCSVHE